AGVLMPGDSFAVSRHLAEEMRAPGDHILTEQVLDTGNNARICQDVINAAIAKMRRADGVTIAARGQGSCQKFIEVTPDGSNLFSIEDPNARQVPVAIEGGNLLARKRCGMLCGR